MLDASGSAYLTGSTDSSNFPTTPGAFQRTLTGLGNAFVSKMNATGSALVYSTYLGGGNDGGSAIALDSSGKAYVTGNTQSTNFPTTSGAFQTVFFGSVDAFVSKMNAAGSTLIYSTFLAASNGRGSQNDNTYSDAVAVDASGNAYIAGFTNSSASPTITDALVSKLNAAGSALVYSNLSLGASGGTGESYGYGIALDASGNAYVTGSSFTVGDMTNAFVSKLNATGAVLYTTSLVDSEAFGVGASGIAVDASGNAYATGRTSSGFPVTPGAFQTGFAGGYSGMHLL